MPTGELTAALPGQPQDGLQQSQYLVVLPVPEVAWLDTVEVKAAERARRKTDLRLGISKAVLTRQLFKACAELFKTTRHALLLYT